MKASEKTEITRLIGTFRLEEAEMILQHIIGIYPADDEAFLLMGHIYRKRSQWQEALQAYAQAMELNPDSPARYARQMISEIMDFYDKERYNV